MLHAKVEREFSLWVVYSVIEIAKNVKCVFKVMLGWISHFTTHYGYSGADLRVSEVCNMTNLNEDGSEKRVAFFVKCWVRVKIR